MSKATEIYHQLKSAIRSGELSPGHQVPEPELAEQYGVARSTIREALVRLEAEKYIELIPRRGARVLPLHVEDLEEIYDILTMIEPWIAEHLAKNAPSSTEIERLEQTILAMEDALTLEDLDAWAIADDQFHNTLLDIYGNKRLHNILSDLFGQAHRARMVTLRIRAVPSQSTVEQRQIFEAIRDGNIEKSASLFRSHRERTSSELVGMLKKTGIRQF